jgi:hypothetical protein
MKSLWMPSVRWVAITEEGKGKHARPAGHSDNE